MLFCVEFGLVHSRSGWRPAQMCCFFFPFSKFLKTPWRSAINFSWNLGCVPNCMLPLVCFNAVHFKAVLLLALINRAYAHIHARIGIRYHHMSSQVWPGVRRFEISKKKEEKYQIIVAHRLFRNTDRESGIYSEIAFWRLARLFSGFYIRPDTRSNVAAANNEDLSRKIVIV